MTANRIEGMFGPPGPLPAVAGPVLEEVALCDLCGSASSEFMFETRDRLHRLPGVFALVRCLCGMVRLSPRPTAQSLPQYYPEEYPPHQHGGIGVEGGRRALGRIRDGLRDEALRVLDYERPRHRWARVPARVFWRQLVRRHAYGRQGFPPFTPGGRALDVGAGNGFFLALLQRHGWEVDGVDLSPTAARASLETFGIPLHVGEVTDDVFAPASFDFVHMSHVIEHVPSPTATVRRIHELLRPGGRLYVETPNIASLGFRLYGRLWFSLDSPRHLYLFTAATLRRLLEDAGFRVDTMRTSVWARPAWEATYLFEERTGLPKERRPSIGLRQWPRIALCAAAAHGARLVAPLSGDVLVCWASRP